MLFCGKSLKTQRVYLFDISKRKDGFQNFTMKDSIPGDETFVTFSTHRADRSPTQPLSSGHVSFHHPKKVTSRIARYRFFFSHLFLRADPQLSQLPEMFWPQEMLFGGSRIWLENLYVGFHVPTLLHVLLGGGGLVDVFFFL